MCATINGLCRWVLILSFSGSLFAGCTPQQTVSPTTETQPALESRPVSSGRFRSVILEDLDNDGHIDLVAGGSPPSTLSISYGDGTGRLTAPQSITIQGEVQSVATADVNRDGFKDIVVSVQRGASGLLVWHYRANRQWVRAVAPTAIDTYQGITCADVNQDGMMDIVAANATSDKKGGIQVWLGDGQGGWPAESGPTKTGTFMDVVVADFNEDGFPDLAGTSWGVHGALRVWLGDGAGSWSGLPPLRQGSFYGLHAGDLNADGHMDLIATTYRSGIAVFFGDGRGGFAEGSRPQSNSSFWDVTVTDLDADGTLDLLASSNVAGGIWAWRFKDRGSWERINGRFPTWGAFYEITTADLDRDGIDDVCAASFGEGVKFWRGSRDVPFSSVADVISRGVIGPAEQAESGVEENDAYTTITGFPEYKIGPGDVIEITRWQGPAAIKEEVLVRPDGRISTEFIEDLRVEGLTPTQLDGLLTEFFKDYLKQPRIDVVVKEYNSKYVSLTGAIGSGIRTAGSGTGAGRYSLTGKVYLLEMVARAGGPSRDANLREVRMRRRNGETLTLNLFRAIYQGDPSQNIVLNSGDLLFFPTLVLDANRVYVFGEVATPGVYKLPEANMRLFDAISEAGGPTVFAEKSSARIVRGSVTRPEIISIDLKKLIEQGDQTQNVMLASGDLIYVPRSAFGDVNQFWQRVRPLFEIVYSPARIVNEWDRALDTLGN